MAKPSSGTRSPGLILGSPRDALVCPDRRLFLAAAGSFTASLMLPRVASAAGSRDPRLVVVILRGALDGLSAAPPIGDPSYAALRPDIRLTRDGDGAALPLDGTFALNPGLKRLHAMFAGGEALVVHAVATPYRDRSHFDGQDALENGTAVPRAVDTGWLNRAVGAMPSGGRAKATGLGVGSTIPLILRGPAPTVSWIPPRLDTARADTIDRLAALYSALDPELARVLEAGVAIDRMASGGKKDPQSAPGLNRMQANFVQLAEGAARLMAAEQGPRVAALSYDGWDTHAKEGGGTGRLTQLLGGLDLALDALRTGLAPVWKETAVVVVTEFGRTVRENGADGTDHGNGTVAFLLGGSVRGGRVLADWPGLAERDLLDARDLKPTLDLRAVLKGVLADHLGLPAGLLAEKIFPDSARVAPQKDLFA